MFLCGICLFTLSRMVNRRKRERGQVAELGNWTRLGPENRWHLPSGASAFVVTSASQCNMLQLKRSIFGSALFLPSNPLVHAYVSWPSLVGRSTMFEPGQESLREIK